MKNKAIFLILFFVSILQPVFTQEESFENLPVWLLMERGKEFFEKGDFGTAFRIFRQVLENQRTSPEAHMWLARVYEEEGEYSLSERHYQNALEDAKDLYILEDRYVILYRLASMYEISGQFGKYEKILRDILESDSLTIQDIAQRNAMIRNLKESGLTKMIELYRINISPFQKAYAEAGIFYYRTGRYSESIEHLAMAVLNTFSSCLSVIFEQNPSFEFSNADNFLESCMQNELLSVYLVRSQCFVNMYYLGCALFAEGELTSAIDVWKLVKTYSDDRDLKYKVDSQLRSPYIEPILTIN